MIALRIYFAALILIFVDISPAQGARPPISITLDGSASPSVRDSASVTIVAQIDSIPGVAMGPLVVSCRVRDENGRTLFDKERVEPVPKDSGFPRLITRTFLAGPGGKLKVRFQAKGLEFDGDGRAEFEMNVPRFSKETFLVSTPRVGTFPLEQAENDTEMPVGFRDLPSHRFVSGRDVVGILLSLGIYDWDYWLPSNVTDSLSVRVVLRRDSRVVKDSSYVAWRGERTSSRVALLGIHRIILRENPARWGGGQYKFQITLTAPTLTAPIGTVQRTGDFQVAVGGADLLGDPVLVRTALGYIATGEERLEIETASTDSLPSVWDRFWKRRDPSPGTAANEALDRFLDRVNQATNRFGGVVPGWKSDRGRILIQHGDPERTERVFDPSTRTDTEIWYYDQRNMSYVFQDPEGFGNYKLTGGQ